ncbi:hypothetical protein MUK42_17581 [Musa troglodytarum]|uniref:C3H1-type domain-containing protein n=1 Tax=Musa troglodytarum TaxID=320322 RepID=A0A9E7KRV1_9LILI|nr:hypothetical protein MUK42_17581 [Musa troglodytarum]URE27142.1 hypothetical protein MUK42_17581 [Musa troglodytarum]URE27146.1 hypothetical protein MUK42_17581 [Musa troglodytarum]URE27147.1 hypothetical protein MUK42_17581 [Musa troglodytarum]
MEDVFRSPATVETLNPRTGSYSRSIPPPRRRSHLDSASYRTLVRIFSLCLDESLVPNEEPRKDPIPVLGAASHEVPKSSSAGKDAVVDSHGDGIVSKELRRDGSESIECGNALFNSDLKYEGIEEKFGDGNGGNRETVNVLVCERPQTESGDDKAEASHSMEEMGHQREETGQCVDGGVQEGLIVESKSETQVCTDEATEAPGDNMIFDFPELVELQDSIIGLVGGSHGEVAEGVSGENLSQFPVSKDQVTDLVGESEQRMNNELKDECVKRASSEDLTDEFNALSVSPTRMPSSNELLRDIMFEKNRECTNPSATYLSPNEQMLFKPRKNESKSINETAEKDPQELLGFSMKQSEENLADALVDPNNVEEIEEGQIPGDFWSLNETGPAVHHNALVQDQKLDEGSCHTDFLQEEGPDCLAKLSGKNIMARNNKSKEDVLFMEIDEKMDGNSYLSSDETHSTAEMKKSCSNVPVMYSEQQTTAVNVVNEKIKRRRGPLTEERKAKKKKAKKRKRAEKERQQGVKRLKLQPVVKPKAVKLCNFYLMGRCQQGDLCKFSHDATPLTKSQPCKYFACDSCLKGDDCPFDHELSKYPCHNFHSKGSCHRGDRCKFSHKISTVEGSSTPTAGNLVSPLTSGKFNVGNQKIASKKPTNARNPPKTATSGTKSVLPKQSEGNLVKIAKEPMQIPNGIRFISFGNGPSESGKLSANSLLPEKHGCSQKKPEKPLADGRKNAVCLSEKSLSKPQMESSVSLPATNVFSGNYLKNKSSSSDPASRSLQSEVSDASKILEEFLFGATG